MLQKKKKRRFTAEKPVLRGEKMEKLKVGVIGIGQLGQHHSRIYNAMPQVDLVGICDTDPARHDKAREYNTGFFTDYKELIGKVDAVNIAVPTYLHHKIAKDFLESNTHVLIEKPITNTLEEADELIAIARDKNLFLRVGHIERFNAAFRAGKKMAKKIKFIEVHRLGPFTPRVKDCGVVLDLMIHDLDIVLSLLRSQISYLDAVGVSVLSKHEDIANVRLKFENGAIVNLTASRLTPEKKRKIRIFQDDACITIDYQNQDALIYKKEFFHISEKKVDIEKEEPLKNELIAFIESVSADKAEDRVDLDARNALDVALQILESIQKNHKTILASQ
jgi:predicted dehydrogenase